MHSNYTISKIPKDERPREKLINYGAEVLSNSELLALIIGVGSKEDSAITLSQKILSKDNKGLQNITDLSIEQLKTFKGINNAKAAKIVALSQLSKRISSYRVDKFKISSPESVASLLMEEMRNLKKEYFKIVLLDTKNKVINIKTISIGCLDSTVVHPREVFVEAIKHSCASIILVHNHPSGDCDPSKEDKNITNRMIECGNIIGIKVLDHIVIGDGLYFSFKEYGLM